MTEPARGARHDTRFRLPGEIRGRGLHVVLGCFAGAVAAESAALLSHDTDLGLRIAASWARDDPDRVFAWTSDGLLSRAIESRQALVEAVGDGDGPGTRAVAGAVRTHDRVIGAIYAGFEPPSRQLPEELGWTTDSYARLAGLCMPDQGLSVAAAIGSGSFDPLTGCLTYGAVLEAMRGELLRSHRRGHHVSACMLDLDGFKRVNDERGHLEGNRVLAAVGEALSLGSRRYDSVGRFGGDEFMIVMPETDAHDACQVAQRLLAAVTDAVAEVTPVPVRASIGIAEWDGDTGALDLFDSADRAMRVAKREGGARVQAQASGRPRLDGLAELSRQLARPLRGEGPRR